MSANEIRDRLRRYRWRSEDSAGVADQKVFVLTSEILPILDHRVAQLSGRPAFFSRSGPAKVSNLSFEPTYNQMCRLVLTEFPFSSDNKPSQKIINLLGGRFAQASAAPRHLQALLSVISQLGGLASVVRSVLRGYKFTKWRSELIDRSRSWPVGSNARQSLELSAS